MPDRPLTLHLDRASPVDMYRAAGLNAADIERKVLEVLGIGMRV